jgi:hypothetical protein
MHLTVEASVGKRGCFELDPSHCLHALIRFLYIQYIKKTSTCLISFNPWGKELGVIQVS